MKKALLCFLLVLVCLVSSGCWDLRDITTRAIVTAIGVDKTAATGPAKYNFTFEIIKPAILKEQSQEVASIVETVEGVSLWQAIEQLQVKMPRLIFLGHLRLVIIGEEAGKENFKDIADMILRQPEVAKRVDLSFVQNGLARDVLQVKPKLDKYITAGLVTMDQLEYELPLTRMQPFYELLNELRSTAGRGLATRVTTENNKGFIREGGAVFNSWKLIGWLNDEEIKAANWLEGKADTTVVGNLGNSIYTYRSDQKKLSIKPLVQNGSLRILISLKTKGCILSKQESDLDLTKPDNITKLEELFTGVIASQVESAIKKSQALGVDYLGIGNAVKRKEPKLYKSLKWEEVYPIIPIDIQVDSEIERFGMMQ